VDTESQRSIVFVGCDSFVSSGREDEGPAAHFMKAIGDLGTEP